MRGGASYSGGGCSACGSARVLRAGDDHGLGVNSPTSKSPSHVQMCIHAHDLWSPSNCADDTDVHLRSRIEYCHVCSLRVLAGSGNVELLWVQGSTGYKFIRLWTAAALGLQVERVQLIGPTRSA